MKQTNYAEYEIVGQDCYKSIAKNGRLLEPKQRKLFKHAQMLQREKEHDHIVIIKDSMMRIKEVLK